MKYIFCFVYFTVFGLINELCIPLNWQYVFGVIVGMSYIVILIKNFIEKRR